MNNPEVRRQWRVRGRACQVFGLTALGLAAGSAPAWTSTDGTLNVSGYVDNVTYQRNRVGLTKSRFTGVAEITKDFGAVGVFSGGLKFNTTLRGSYDAAYDWNSDDYGEDAGGAIQIEDQVFGSVPFGGGLGSATYPISGAALGLPGNGGFGFDTTANPNAGLQVLGEGFHRANGGVVLGVPVRPCDVDPRGCIDDYLDFDEDELKSPEFNDRADAIREAYFSGSIAIGAGDSLDISLGRRQLVWGRTDLFRVLDIINPVDYSRHNIYDELEDIRIPMGMLTVDYRAGATDVFDDMNFQLVWKWEKFRPNNLGQGGQPYAILDAGYFFRAMNNCWENGCTVANFANGVLATDFPAHTIGIRQANLPDWEMENTDVGMRFEGVFKSVGFSLNAFYYYSQLPSLHGGNEGPPARNPFLGAGVPFGAPFPAEVGGDEIPRDYLIAFDIEFPRVFMLGGSTDFYVDSIKSAFRTEFAWTTGEEFANTLERNLYSESDVIRWVVGWDRPTFIKPLNKNRAFLLSAQVFGQHLLDHELRDGPLGPIGMADWQDNFIGTFLFKGFYMNDQLSPQVITAYDVRAQAGVVAPSIDWLISNHWQITFGANLKFGHGARAFDDNRSANPFPPFTCPPGPVCTTTSQSLGLGGLEPLGRFRSGPIGMAQEEDELQLTVRYRF